MDADAVSSLLRRIASAGVDAWAAGGWAVDALVGRQTRPHRDLDLAVDERHVPALLRLLEADGFLVTVDWTPVRLELTAPDGRIVDVHPVAFSEDGSGLQAGLDGGSFAYAASGFTTGRIEGSPVPCLSIEQQLEFRTGYPHRPVDRHDISLLTGLLPGAEKGSGAG